MFCPGIIGTLGKYIFSSNLKTVDKFVSGEQHRKQRKMLNPAFLIAHLRDMSKLWPFFRSPRTERAIAPTFYRVSYKVSLHLNLPYRVIDADHRLAS